VTLRATGTRRASAHFRRRQERKHARFARRRGRRMEPPEIGGRERLRLVRSRNGVDVNSVRSCAWTGAVATVRARSGNVRRVGQGRQLDRQSRGHLTRPERDPLRQLRPTRPPRPRLLRELPTATAPPASRSPSRSRCSSQRRPQNGRRRGSKPRQGRPDDARGDRAQRQARRVDRQGHDRRSAAHLRGERLTFVVKERVDGSSPSEGSFNTARRSAPRSSR
jgi:hypothetical protein